MREKQALAITLLLAAGGFAFRAAAAPSGPSAAKPAPVGVALEGLTEPWETFSVGLSAEGIVEEVSVERGGRVQEGDLIMELESSVERARYELALAKVTMTADLEAAQAQGRLARARAERYRELFASGTVTREELDEVLAEEELAAHRVRAAEEGLAGARLELRVAEALLAQRTVLSPADGFVTELFVSPGQAVGRGGPLEVARVAQLQRLKIDLIAPLSLFGAVEVGQSVLVSLQAPIGGVHGATVSEIDAWADAASGTFRIRIELLNEDLSLPAGVRCGVQLAE